MREERRADRGHRDPTAIQRENVTDQEAEKLMILVSVCHVMLQGRRGEGQGAMDATCPDPTSPGLTPIRSTTASERRS